MTFRRYLGAAAVLLLGAAPTPAFSAPPASFTLRYSAQGWADVGQAAAASVSCTTNTPECPDTHWVDVDHDPSTVNSSRAVLAVPPRAAVDWVGLYWSGDRGGPRCDAGSLPAVPPPAPDRVNQVKVAVNDGAYSIITAGTVTSVTGPKGGAGFQAYADITALLRPVSSQMSLTVADVQVAQGPGCSGGWAVMLAYSYPDGPDRTYAPTYRSIAVFDGVVEAHGGQATPVRLDGLVTPGRGVVEPRLAMSLLASGQALGSGGVSLDGVAVPRNGPGVTGVIGVPGPGYQLATAPVPPTAIAAGATSATLALTPVRGGFVGAVLGLSTLLPVTVDLSVTAVVNPPTVPVGGETAMTVTVRNDAEVTAYGVSVTAHLPAGLSMVADVPGYDPRTGQWSAGKVIALGSTSLTLRLRAAVAGAYTSTAVVTASEIPDVDTRDDISSVTVTAVDGTPSAPPDLVAPPVVWQQTWLTPPVLFGTGLFLLGLFLLSVALVGRRR